MRLGCSRGVEVGLGRGAGCLRSLRPNVSLHSIARVELDSTSQTLPRQVRSPLAVRSCWYHHCSAQCACGTPWHACHVRSHAGALTGQ